MKRALLLGLLLTACASAPTSSRSIPPSGPSSSAARPSSVAAASFGDAGPIDAHSGATDDTTEYDTDDPLVVFESPYKLGQRPRPGSAAISRREDQELADWNEGGREGKWHPQPRVMVDNVRVRGRASDAMVLRETRKQHYWAIRKCYDAALASDQKLHGKVHVQFTIKHAGTVKSAKAIGKATLPDTTAVDCIVRSLSSLKFPATSRGDAVVTLDIGLNPGDLPVHAPEDPAVEPGPGTLDMHAVQAIVAGRIGHTTQECYEQALTRVPSVWGRLALRADIDASGHVRDIVEVESTFPDPVMITCVQDSLRKVVFPAPTGGDLRLVIPIRFGSRDG
jgi:hypothetical protein